jgi:hypothetical protein
MSSTSWKSIGTGAVVLIAILLRSGSAAAQPDQAISEATLREPWNQQLAVLQSLSGSITAANADSRSQLGDALAILQVALGEFEVQVDQVIDRVLADAQFAFAAAETSQALSAQLAEVHARFDALYAVLGVQERADVRAAQASLDTLQKILQDKMHFERDVERALGSGTRQQRVELATRWWNGEERAIAVKKLVADLREKLEAVYDKKPAED